MTILFSVVFEVIKCMQFSPDFLSNNFQCLYFGTIFFWKKIMFHLFLIIRKCNIYVKNGTFTLIRAFQSVIGSLINWIGINFVLIFEWNDLWIFRQLIWFLGNDYIILNSIKTFYYWNWNVYLCSYLNITKFW